MDAISFANNSQHCWMLNAASFSTLCCMFWEVVAQGLKPVKLLACKQTQRFPKVLGVVGQQCCVRFHGASIGKTITACASRFCTFLCCHWTIDYDIKMFKGSTIWLLREGEGGYQWFGLCGRITRVICWFSFFPWHIRFFSQHCSPLKIYFFSVGIFFSLGIFPCKNFSPRIQSVGYFFFWNYLYPPPSKVKWSAPYFTFCGGCEHRLRQRSTIFFFSWISIQSFIACEQALLYGRAKRVSWERASERRSREGQRLTQRLARSREARFARPNRRAC